jgi:hypothetical protein
VLYFRVEHPVAGAGAAARSGLGRTELRRGSQSSRASYGAINAGFERCSWGPCRWREFWRIDVECQGNCSCYIFAAFLWRFSTAAAADSSAFDYRDLSKPCAHFVVRRRAGAKRYEHNTMAERTDSEERGTIEACSMALRILWENPWKRISGARRVAAFAHAGRLHERADAFWR